MNNHPINSLLETDLYKYSMGQAVLHWFPRTSVKVEFKCRSDADLAVLKPRIDEELDWLCSLRYRKDEIDYIRSIPWFTGDFADYLERFYLKRDQIATGIDQDGKLTIVAEGPWRDVMHFEIPVLAIVSQLYMERQCEGKDIGLIWGQGDSNLSDAMDKFRNCFDANRRRTGLDIPFALADFGIRRRFSADWHDHVVARLMDGLPGAFVGTSNVYLAKKYGIKPIGTFAHEWFMGIQGENVRLSEVQKTALDIWAKEYRGELGIALSDIFGFNAFLRDFDKYFAKLFDGCRHDSGNPFTWGEMLIDHYRKLGIDPMTKTGCWSDSLDADKACSIADHFCGRIKTSFGIGTFLTNSLGPKPLNMVMKLVESNGTPVAKLSDSPGKGMCHDQRFVEYLKQVYDYRCIDEK